MDENEKIIPLREVCKLINLKPTTIRKWAQTGKIKFIKTPTGQILYPESQFKSLISSVISVKEEISENRKIIYCRVSSKKQLEDLERQVNFLRMQFPTHTIITDCASGINWKRKGLKSILEYAMSGNLEELVVAHRDRLARFGFELIEWIIQHKGGKVVVLEENECKSTEQELAEDLLSIVHVYTCRQMGKRRYRTSKNIEDKTLSYNNAETNSKTMDRDK
jgi:predicted site-specific integrase-resolvase